MIDTIITHPIAIGFALAFLVHMIPEVLTKASLIISEARRNNLYSAIGLSTRFVFGCFKCVAFWLIWATSGSIGAAAIVAAIIYLISHN
jgi:hypothetical protein